MAQPAVVGVTPVLYPPSLVPAEAMGLLGHGDYVESLVDDKCSLLSPTCPLTILGRAKSLMVVNSKGNPEFLHLLPPKSLLKAFQLLCTRDGCTMADLGLPVAATEASKQLWLGYLAVRSHDAIESARLGHDAGVAARAVAAAAATASVATGVTVTTAITAAVPGSATTGSVTPADQPPPAKVVPPLLYPVPAPPVVNQSTEVKAMMRVLGVPSTTGVMTFATQPLVAGLGAISQGLIADAVGGFVHGVGVER